MIIHDWKEARKGEVTRKNNGRKVIDLSIENDPIIRNTNIKTEHIHKYTREGYNRGEKSIIGYFLVKKIVWVKIKEIQVKRSAEIESDHYMVRMKKEVKKEKNQGKKEIDKWKNIVI